MVVAWILAALFLVVAVAVIIYFTKSRKSDRLYIRQQQHDISKLKQDVQSLETKAKTSERNYQDTLLSNCDLLKTISDLRIELSKYENSDEVELTRINTLINERLDKLNTLDESIKVSSDKLTLLENDYTARQNELAAQLQSSNDSRATLLEEQNRLQESILTAQKEVDALHDQKVAVENELVTLRNELGQLAIRSRTALLENWKDVGELGIKWEATNKETQLVAAINDICALYPELSRELKKIEWEKVWRPKMQVYRNELAGKQGIYKLTLIEDVEVCYIGQARNIYERWFEHAKKMIGVEPKGNEKLYEYKVGDFYWKVIEEVDDANKLNEAEKYWIDYWCCLEKGLNKKK